MLSSRLGGARTYFIPILVISSEPPTLPATTISSLEDNATIASTTDDEGVLYTTTQLTNGTSTDKPPGIDATFPTSITIPTVISGN